MDTLMMLASEEGNGFWLPADKREVLWGTLAFLIVMGLLYKFAWPSIRTAMTGRTERIGESLDEAAELRAAAEAERDEIKSALADSDTEAARIVAEARDTASTLIADAAARAEADAAAIRERIPAEIEAAHPIRPGRPVRRGVEAVPGRHRGGRRRAARRGDPAGPDRELHLPDRREELT